MRPSRTTSAPFSMMPSSRISAPIRGRAGPASVTNWRQLTIARSGIHGPPQAVLARKLDRFRISGIHVPHYAGAWIAGEHALEPPRGFLAAVGHHHHPGMLRITDA